MNEFRRHETTLQGGFALALEQGNAEASLNAPASWPLMKAKIPLERLTSDAVVPFKWENTDYILSGAPVADRGLIVVAMPLPQKFSETVKQLDASQHRYLELTPPTQTGAPHLHGTAAPAHRAGAVFDDLAGAVPLQTGDPPGGGAGRSHAGDFARTPGLPRGSQRRRRNRRSGAVFQPHGGRTGNQPASDRRFQPRSGRRQHRPGTAPPAHRDHSGEHSHRRAFARRQSPDHSREPCLDSHVQPRGRGIRES